MPSRKTHDLAVKTGSYTTRDGETKNRYENIGALMEGDNGPYLMLKRTFNPAGVPGSDGKDSILVSCFQPQDQGNHRGEHQRDSGGQRDTARQAPPPARHDLDDEIPF